MRTYKKTWCRGLFKSMGIAYKNFFRKKITVQYPHERLELPERARWAVEMVLDEDGAHKCTTCLMCQKACPDFIIDITTSKAEDGTKMIDTWRYDIGACMMCGFCVESCNFGAIRMSHNYELARTDPSTLTINLLENVPVAKPKPKAKPAAAKPAADGAAAKPVAKPADGDKPAATQGAAEGAAAPVAKETAAKPAEKAADTGAKPTETPAETSVPEKPAEKVQAQDEVSTPDTESEKGGDV